MTLTLTEEQARTLRVVLICAEVDALQGAHDPVTPRVDRAYLAAEADRIAELKGLLSAAKV
jgi:hypothetical protein